MTECVPPICVNVPLPVRPMDSWFAARVPPCMLYVPYEPEPLPTYRVVETELLPPVCVKRPVPKLPTVSQPAEDSCPPVPRLYDPLSPALLPTSSPVAITFDPPETTRPTPPLPLTYSQLPGNRPADTWSVPALTVVLPKKVLEAVSTSMPAPIFCGPPLPDRVPFRVSVLPLVLK